MLDETPGRPMPASNEWIAAETLYPVVYADTDAQGVVYHGKYLEMAERSRAAAIAAVGLDQRRAVRENKVHPVINKAQIKYLEPIFLHDIVRITTRVSRAGSAHIWWRTSFFVEDALRATVDASTIFLDPDSKEIIGVPDRLLHRMRANHQEKQPCLGCVCL
jgi:acyl-CoA thioester hydrolase